MYILGIESSCDETAAAVIKTSPRSQKVEILSNIISSQIAIHKKYGGVVPEVAAREHVLNILPVIDEALTQAKIQPQDLKVIGVTQGPGLITSLITGVETARTLAYAWHKPIMAVNHIDGHIYSSFISPASPIKFPAIILTVSGGHTILLLMAKSGKIKILGETRDDAAGEAYDKAAKMLDLGYPGGPIISHYAAEYEKTLSLPGRGKKSTDFNPIVLPRPMLNSANLDFSFSGLKTALLYLLQKDPHWKTRVPEYCFEYQQAIIDILISKTIKGAKKYKTKTVMLSGGVSANTELRQQMSDQVGKKLPGVNFITPDRAYTTDNAAMIATAAAYKIKREKPISFKQLRVNASLQLK
jgi:N6-L-threonylcarbamoyladenine synthase